MGGGARDDRQFALRLGSPGWQHSHPAARQESVSFAGAHHPPKSAGIAGRVLAGSPLFKTADIRDLRQPGLSGLGDLRDGSRRAALFRKIGARRDAGRGRGSGRAVESAVALLATEQPESGDSARENRGRRAGHRAIATGWARRRAISRTGCWTALGASSAAAGEISLSSPRWSPVCKRRRNGAWPRP